MADDRDKWSIGRSELPPPPSDEYVARVARALGAPPFKWNDAPTGDEPKSDETAQAAVE